MPMKIAIIGATGRSGSLILQEALNRGHEVTAIVRDRSRLQNKEVPAVEKDIMRLSADDLKPFDAVVCAFRAPAGQEEQYVEAGKVLIEALKGAPNTKLFVVGGAGSLFADEARTTRLMDTPEFPKMVYPTAFNMGEQLKLLQQAEGITWTFLSPAQIFDPNGPRTGKYRTGKDVVLYNEEGKSYISYADYAIAVLDELENPRHVNERYTVVGSAG
jgi:hypothetical protein